MAALLVRLSPGGRAGERAVSVNEYRPPPIVVLLEDDGVMSKFYRRWENSPGDRILWVIADIVARFVVAACAAGGTLYAIFPRYLVYHFSLLEILFIAGVAGVIAGIFNIRQGHGII